MKILHIVDYLMPMMGYQEFILPKFNAKNRNNDVTILTSNAYYPVPNYNSTWKRFLGNRIFKPKNENIDNVKIIREKKIFEIFRRPWILNLEKNIKLIEPEIIMVHGTTSFNSIRTLKVAKKNKIPIIFDNHMVFSVVRKNFIGKLFYFIVKNFTTPYIQNYASVIYGVTEETCEYLVAMEGYKKDKLKLLNLGVDSSVFYPEKKNHPNKNNINIIQTGKLNKDKGPEILAKAVIKLLKRGKNIYLTYYGDGDEQIIKNINKLFKDNNFENSLKFEKFVEYKNLGKIYNSADICVFPYGTSLSAIECAFCGTNVVMTNDMASREREKDGIGICYETGNVDDLVKKIDLLSSKFSFYKKELLNNLSKIKEKYDYNIISKKFEKECNLLINEKKY